MNFSMSNIMASFIFGVLGLYMFREGKRLQIFELIILGIVLMVYPYFTEGPWADWGVGCALFGLAYYFRWKG